MTIQLYPLECVVPNPWNERPLDQANVDRIAASLQRDGLLQPPLGRPDPALSMNIQLAFGHHRVAAYRQLFAAAAARAQVIAAARKTHVRGHTPLPGIGHSRPAPKPSALKKARKVK